MFSRPNFASAFLFAARSRTSSTVQYTKFTRTRDQATCQHARLLRVRRPHATRRPETQHARRSGAAQPAEGLSSPSPSLIPPAEPLHHSNPPHRQGSNFSDENAPSHPVLQPLRQSTCSDRPDFQTSCVACDLGRNIKRWSHSERALPSTSRRHFGGREETFFSTLENFSEL